MEVRWSNERSWSSSNGWGSEMDWSWSSDSWGSNGWSGKVDWSWGSDSWSGGNGWGSKVNWSWSSSSNNWMGYSMVDVMGIIGRCIWGNNSSWNNSSIDTSAKSENGKDLRDLKINAKC